MTITIKRKALERIIRSVFDDVRINPEAVSTKIKLLSFNAFFDGPLFLERFEFVVKQSSQLNCDVLCFQEVLAADLETREDVFTDCKKILIKHGFVFIYPEECSFMYYTLLTASRIPFTKADKIQYNNTIMGREFHHLSFKVESGVFHILNTHLESMFQFQKTRNKQIKQLTDHIKQNNIQDNCLVCGDFNMTFKKIYGLDGFLTPQVNFVTWFAERFFGKKRSCRFDRVYTGKNIEINKLTSCLNKPISELGIYPSDHDGIFIELVLKK